MWGGGGGGGQKWRGQRRGVGECWVDLVCSNTRGLNLEMGDL